MYYICPKKNGFTARNTVLYVASLLFYAWGEPIYVFLMLFSSVFNYIAALYIEKFRGKHGSVILLTISLIVNFGLLFAFKYLGFAAGIIGLTIKTVALPVGISFYTFQAVSYVIDVFRGHIAAQKKFLIFGTYIVFFPQLIAGPIVRYSDMEASLKGRTESLAVFGDGAFCFTKGLLKKVVFANSMGILFENCKSDSSVLSAWLGAIAFSLQLYYDFGGYSDMAMGLGKMFGFSLPRNFNYPYISESVTEFWRRWHITLGVWFRDYLYFSLGGSRVSESRTYINLLIVWFCTGLWHGAGLNFIVWGLYFGCIIIAEKAFLLKILKKIPAVFRHLWLLLAVVVGWVLFSSESIEAAVSTLKTMFFANGTEIISERSIYLFYTNAILLSLCVMLCIPLPRPKNTKFIRIIRVAAGALALFAVTAFLVADSYNPFLYFRF